MRHPDGAPLNGPAVDGRERCGACGARHVVVIREVVVRTRAEAERVRALNGPGSGP